MKEEITLHKKVLELVPITPETPLPLEEMDEVTNKSTVQWIVSLLQEGNNKSGGLDLFSETEQESNGRMLEDFKKTDPEAYRQAERVIAFYQLSSADQQKIINAVTAERMHKKVLEIKKYPGK
jgi:hypothetical protein